MKYKKVLMPVELHQQKVELVVDHHLAEIGLEWTVKENKKILDWEVLMKMEQHVKKVETGMKFEDLVLLDTQHTKGVAGVVEVVE